MTQTETTTLTYEGPPALVSALAWLLREEGLTVDYEAPDEARDLAAIADGITSNVIVLVAVAGTPRALEAIPAVLERFRSWFGARVKIKVKGKHRADDDE